MPQSLLWLAFAVTATTFFEFYVAEGRIASEQGNRVGAACWYGGAAALAAVSVFFVGRIVVELSRP